MPPVSFAPISPGSRGWRTVAAERQSRLAATAVAVESSVMLKKIVPSLVALALASVCGVAQAENVSFTGFTHGSETVTATLTGPNVPVTKTISAGGFNTILNGSASFEAYCVDLYQTITFGAPPYPEYTFAGLGHAFTNLNAYTDLGRLYATAGAVTNSVAEAAFQIAVWEISYETTGTAYNLGSGAATFAGGTAATSGALTLAANWLGQPGRHRPEHHHPRQPRAPGRGLRAGSGARDLCPAHGGPGGGGLHGAASAQELTRFPRREKGEPGSPFLRLAHARQAPRTRLLSWHGAVGPVHNRAMHDAVSVAARRRPPAWQRWLLAACLASGSAALAADPAAQPTIVLDQALSTASVGTAFPSGVPTTSVTLPDDWAKTNPGHDGAVWYRVAFRFAEATLPDELLALYLDRACTNLQVLLNGHLIYSGGRMVEPVTRNCARPVLITLPPALLNPNGNALDLRVLGHPAQSVGSIRRAGGLSEVRARAAVDPRQGPCRAHVLGAGMDPRHQPGAGRPGLPAAGDRLAAPARGLFRLLRLALPRLGRRVDRDLDPGPALGERRHRVHAELGLAGAPGLRRAVLPELRRPALAHDREHRRRAMGRACPCRCWSPGPPTCSWWRASGTPCSRRSWRWWSCSTC